MIWQANALQDFFFNLSGFVYEHDNILDVGFDSRSLKVGGMFFALSGDNSDGHDFAEHCIDNGAACCVVSKDLSSLVSPQAWAKCILVPNVMDAFVKLAAYRKTLLSATTIAITGSVGKTTSKFGLVHFLKKINEHVFCAPNSFNNILGIAFLYNCVPFDTQFLIVEIGTNAFGEIAQLAQFVEPDYSLITHISVAHIGDFKKIGNILREKADIIKYTKKCTFFNGDFWYEFFLKKVANESGVNYEVFHNQDGLDSALCTLKSAWQSIFSKLQLPFLDDSVFGKNLVGRRDLFQVRLNNCNLDIIDSSYNANLASMLDALQFLQRNFPNSHKIAILGDMKGVDHRAKRYHEILNCYLDNVDLVLLVGDYMQYLRSKNDRYLWFENNDELIEYLQSSLNYESVILIKGSNSINLNQVVRFFASFRI